MGCPHCGEVLFTKLATVFGSDFVAGLPSIIPSGIPKDCMRMGAPSPGSTSKLIPRTLCRHHAVTFSFGPALMLGFQSINGAMKGVLTVDNACSKSRTIVSAVRHRISCNMANLLWQARTVQIAGYQGNMDNGQQGLAL